MALVKTAGLAAITACALLAPPFANAHGGGLNAEGCHNNRKTGDYHCHRAPAAAPAPRQESTQLAPVRKQPKRAEAAKTKAAVSYANCSEARAAGAAPVYVDDPGYAAHLDRDNDGIGCE